MDIDVFPRFIIGRVHFKLEVDVEIDMLGEGAQCCGL